jgi:hypothetical protein
MSNTSGALLALLALVCLAAPELLCAADWKSIKPSSHAGRVELSVDSRTLSYYAFDSDEGLSFAVDGPNRVKVLTRLRIDRAGECHIGPAPYTVDVVRDGVLVESVEKTSVPSSHASYVDLPGFAPGRIRRVYIDVPSGRHAYSLSISGDGIVDARVFVAADDRPKLVSLAPTTYAEAVVLYYRDKELTYYLLTNDTGVTLDVVGPTTVKVNTRLLFDSTMSKTQTYTLAVREDDGAERMYKIEARPSETVVLRDRTDVIPGALRSFELEVGAGLHNFEFRLADVMADELALKFYIPRGDLGNEP